MANNAPANTSLIKCTPDMTRMKAISADIIRSNIPAQGNGQNANTVSAIIKAEKTCLLGKELPFLSLRIADGV